MSTGLQRAVNAASETRRRTTGRPSKPWRVYGCRCSAPVDCPSERSAYEAVATLVKLSGKATVYHWEDGSWRLYERIEPTDHDTTGEQQQ